MKRSYLYRLAILILLGMMIPIVAFLIFFWIRSLKELEQTNEIYYDTLVESYVSSHESRLRELENYVAKLHVQSKDSTSVFFQGEDIITSDNYQLYLAMNEVNETYSLEGIRKWGIYFYDSGRVFTYNAAMVLDMFVKSYFINVIDQSDIYEFFAKENYGRNRIYFGISGKEEESDKRSLLIGICTRIGKYNDEALIFFEMDADDYFDSLLVRRELGHAYYLIDEAKETVLISSGESLNQEDELLLFEEADILADRMKARILYKSRSDFSGVSIVMYITGDSLQNRIIAFSHDMRYILGGVIVGLILIGVCIVYITYKPIHELTKEIDEEEGNEIEIIQRTLDSRQLKITEQEMMIMDLLLNHMLYGVHVSEQKLNCLGIDPAMKYYCVFLLSDYVILSGEAGKLTEKVEEKLLSRLFVTDWQDGEDSIFILFADSKERKAEVEQILLKWMQDSFIKGYSLYAGTVVDCLDDIQISLRSCLEQRAMENSAKAGDREENNKGSSEQKQKEKKDEILAYLEMNFRDPNLCQTEIADLFGISNYTLSRLFKNKVGVGFSEYLSAKRIECASTLLLTTDHSISEVAAMSGFSSINYFSKTFKAYAGVSPSNYRNQK